MYVLIAGGGRTGMQLSMLLLSEGYKVRLIENRPDLLEHLHQELPTEVIYEGLSTDPEVLEAAGIRQAHILADETGHPGSAHVGALHFLRKGGQHCGTGGNFQPTQQLADFGFIDFWHSSGLFS